MNVPTIAERLKKGAGILGKLWREGVRCQEEMSVMCPEDNPFEPMDCFCEPKNKFCTAKKQWLSLVIVDERPEMAGSLGYREIVQGPFGLIETMSGSEWDATGMTVKFEFPGAGVHGIGPHGIMGREDIVKLLDAPETLNSIIMMAKNFKGMKVQEVVQPTAIAVE